MLAQVPVPPVEAVRSRTEAYRDSDQVVVQHSHEEACCTLDDEDDDRAAAHSDQRAERWDRLLQEQVPRSDHLVLACRQRQEAQGRRRRQRERPSCKEARQLWAMQAAADEDSRDRRLQVVVKVGKVDSRESSGQQEQQERVKQVMLSCERRELLLALMM